MGFTVAEVKAFTEPGTYGDGDGLYLQISAKGHKSWIFRFQLAGKRREMGLGGLADVGLAEARRKAQEARQHVLGGRDPIEARKAQRAAQRLLEASRVTFKEAAEAYIEANKAGWRNHKHRRQWTATLEKYAYSTLGSLAVGAIDTSHVLKVLEPVWRKRPETASRVRGRIETVLAAATARGQRTGPNPAQWRNHLDQLLPPRSKVRAVRHQPALPWGEVPVFMAELGRLDSVSAQGLGFAILTAARTGEVTGMRWSEVDDEAKLWTVPPSRMKAGRVHRVPLSDQAMAIVEKMIKVKVSAYVFPGWKHGAPLSDMALLMCLRGLRKGVTVHGFRSAFRDWAAECTAFPNIVCEAVLAHVIGDKSEAAYRRGDLLEKRRQLMQAWADFCLPG
jgi:integrase